ncbi:MAG: hypothetical protein LBQ40_04430 [Clostridiales bacterium]|jgi:hypothetical protein|nr:hypothetical protein [Clostridiales bacterium]
MKNITITISNGCIPYKITSSEYVLGRRYENAATEITIIRPEEEDGRTCIALIDANYTTIDNIPVIDNKFTITSNLSQYPYITLGFVFYDGEGYVQTTESKTFQFAPALKPLDFTPLAPEASQIIFTLLHNDITRIEYDEETKDLIGKNSADIERSRTHLPFLSGAELDAETQAREIADNALGAAVAAESERATAAEQTNAEAIAGKAPKNHASNSSEYGMASKYTYGHVRVGGDGYGHALYSTGYSSSGFDVDLNTFEHCGVYKYVLFVPSVFLNIPVDLIPPSDGLRHYLQIEQSDIRTYSSGDIVPHLIQKVTNPVSGETWQRVKFFDIWHPWQKIATKTDIDALQAAIESDIAVLKDKQVAFANGNGDIEYCNLADLDKDNHGLATDTYVDKKIAAAVSSVLHYIGDVATFADLPTTANMFDLYAVLDEGHGYYWFGGEWNHLDFTVDLSAYYTTTETDSLLALKVDKTDGKGLSSEDYTTTEKSKLAGLNAANYATAEQGAKADSALQSEIDPTVPAWAKATSKPTYTAAEIGAASVGELEAKQDKAPLDNKLYGLKNGGIEEITAIGGGGGTTEETIVVDKATESVLGELSSAATQKDINEENAEAINDKAPKNHASMLTEYGVASSLDYGHIRASMSSGVNIKAICAGELNLTSRFNCNSSLNDYGAMRVRISPPNPITDIVQNGPPNVTFDQWNTYGVSFLFESTSSGGVECMQKITKYSTQESWTRMYSFLTAWTAWQKLPSMSDIPTFAEWAKADTKPTYTAEEVGAATVAEMTNLNAKKAAVYDGADTEYVDLKDLDADYYGLATDTYVDKRVAEAKLAAFVHEEDWAVDAYADLPTSGVSFGDVWKTTDTDKEYYWDGDEWKEFAPAVNLSDYYTASETDSLLALKVDKTDGKGLSSEDYTAAEKEKLAGLDAANYATAEQGAKADSAVQFTPQELTPEQQEQVVNNLGGYPGIASSSLGANVSRMFKGDNYESIGSESYSFTVEFHEDVFDPNAVYFIHMRHESAELGNYLGASQGTGNISFALTATFIPPRIMTYSGGIFNDPAFSAAIPSSQGYMQILSKSLNYTWTPTGGETVTRNSDGMSATFTQNNSTRRLTGTVTFSPSLPYTGFKNVITPSMQYIIAPILGTCPMVDIVPAADNTDNTYKLEVRQTGKQPYKTANLIKVGPAGRKGDTGNPSVLEPISITAADFADGKITIPYTSDAEAVGLVHHVGATSNIIAYRQLWDAATEAWTTAIITADNVAVKEDGTVIITDTPFDGKILLSSGSQYATGGGSGGDEGGHKHLTEVNDYLVMGLGTDTAFIIFGEDLAFDEDTGALMGTVTDIEDKLYNVIVSVKVLDGSGNDVDTIGFNLNMRKVGGASYAPIDAALTLDLSSGLSAAYQVIYQEVDDEGMYPSPVGAFGIIMAGGISGGTAIIDTIDIMEV